MLGEDECFFFGDESDPEVEKVKPACEPWGNEVCLAGDGGRRRFRGLWNGSAGGIGRMIGNLTPFTDERRKIRKEENDKRERSSGEDENKRHKS